MSGKLRPIKSNSEDPAQALALMSATGAHEMMLAEIKRLEKEVARLKRFSKTDAEVIQALTSSVNTLEIELQGYRTARDA